MQTLTQPITISHAQSFLGDNSPLVLIEATGTSTANKGAILWLDSNRGTGVVDVDVFRIDNTNGEIFSIDNAGGIQVNQGQRVDEFSTDGTLAGDSDTALPTEKAVKTYVDNNASASPLTTKGDLYTYDTDNARLPVGTNDYVLTADSTQATGLKWAPSSGGFTDPMTTRGDIIYKNSAGTTTRLGAGTASQVLTSDGTDIAWQDPTGGASDKIEEGNSSVEVIDAGTGYVSTTIDGTEVVRIDPSTLRVGEGLDQSYSGDIFMVSDGGACVFGGRSFSDTATGAPRFEFGRVGGTVASPASLAEGDRIGGLNSLNYTGSYQYTGGIFFINDGAPSVGVAPTKITFETGATNTASRVERFVVKSDGTCQPGADDSQDFGSSSFRWTDIYATNSTIQTSDERLKTKIKPSELGLEFIDALAPKSYKWKDYTVSGTRMIEVCDDDGNLTGEEEYNWTKTYKHRRTHYGMIAQDVIATCSGMGIDTNEFAGIIYDEDADRYGLRYQEFIAPIIKSVQELSAKNKELTNTIEELTKRIEALEAK
jgi:hypothetical protein